jgi:F-type H+-transporting ATPase subunit c
MSTLLPIGVGVCLLATAAAGVVMGLATGKAVDAVARQPEAAGKIQTGLLLGLAITESCAIYGFVTALIMMFSMK